jgi:hypothetical protein
MEAAIVINMYPTHISCVISVNKEGWNFSGSDPLFVTNGCYMSLLSNVVNNCNEYCKKKNIEIVDFIFSRK